MTDEIKQLKKAFELETEIKASDRAKKMALSAAMQAFEKQHETISENESISKKIKKTENNPQGNISETRLKDEANLNKNKGVGYFNPSNWRKLMKFSYLFPVAAAGTLAVSVLVLNPGIISNKISTKNGSDILLEEELVSNNDSAVTGSATKNKQESSKAIVKVIPKAKKANQGQVARRMEKQVESTVVANQISKPQPNVRYDEAIPSPIAAGAVMADMNMNEAVETIAPVPAPVVVVESKRMPNKVVGVSKKMARPARIQQEIPAITQVEAGRDKFESIKTNPLKLTEKEPVSTFSVDVDTASYSFMRAAINRNSLPQKDAVRIEELINYFPYDYPQPTDTDVPFKVSTTVMPTPWNENTKLLHIGIKGYTLPKQETPKSNLVFLLDTSGSMSQPNKLPLLINSFKLLLSTLQDDDTVSIVAYAGSAGTVLEPTKVKEKAKITQALERLSAGGSTAGGQGIRLAYQLAEANYDKKAVNRVILATDGDFNVGIRSQDELKSFIERKRKSGVFLSVLGFGMGNYNDALMQTLAQNGNGNAAYIDSLSEARKVLVEEASSTLFTIAKDVKIQMEFNPKAVSAYRLIGYETRALKREDFNNDKVDAGDIGAGHTVTAIYEITPVGAQNAVDPLRYADKTEDSIAKEKPTEYGFLKLRYKLPNEDKSKLIETPILIADTAENIAATSTETRFATAVAAFGQLLRGGTYMQSFSYDDVIKLAQGAKGDDLFGYRSEFITLVRLAKMADAMRSN